MTAVTPHDMARELRATHPGLDWTPDFAARAPTVRAALGESASIYERGDAHPPLTHAALEVACVNHNRRNFRACLVIFCERAEVERRTAHSHSATEAVNVLRASCGRALPLWTPPGDHPLLKDVLAVSSILGGDSANLNAASRLKATFAEVASHPDAPNPVGDLLSAFPIARRAGIEPSMLDRLLKLDSSARSVGERAAAILPVLGMVPALVAASGAEPDTASVALAGLEALTELLTALKDMVTPDISERHGHRLAAALDMLADAYAERMPPGDAERGYALPAPAVDALLEVYAPPAADGDDTPVELTPEVEVAAVRAALARALACGRVINALAPIAALVAARADDSVP